MKLRVATRPEWTRTALADFDSFLLDHAACERKASASAMSFIAHYPDRTELVFECLALAREELEHFQLVCERIAARGLVLARDSKDPYVGRLTREFRQGSHEYFLDRLLVAGVIEARGCERFGLVGAALPPGELREFYRGLARSEARHHELFVRLAERYFDRREVAVRLEELLEAEARIVSALPLRAAVH